MIIIFSDKSDQSTNSVIDWLIFLNVPFLRVNERDIFFINEIVLSNKENRFVFKINNQGKEYDLFRFTSAWYRRGRVNLFTDKIKYVIEAPYLQEDFEGLRQFVTEYLTNLNWLSNFNHNINKLHVIKKAADFGLEIPHTFCTNDLNRAAKYYNNYFITKSIQRSQSLNNQQLYTEEVSPEFIEQFNGSLFSLYQEKIEKFCDIRAFYIEGKFFAMAIISQNNDRTQIDFRKYDRQTPNRKTPFKLPSLVTKKLKKLFDFFSLSCCSFDMVLDKNNNYLFLEINPVGQFSMTSQPCNYKLEKEIALCLKK